MGIGSLPIPYRLLAIIVAAQLGAAAGGCIELGDEIEDLGWTAQGICDTSECFNNSANINGMSIAEINLDGLASPSGFRLSHVLRANSSLVFQLAEAGSVLYADDGAGSLSPLVVGDQIVVIDVGSGMSHPLRVEAIAQIPTWYRAPPAS